MTEEEQYGWIITKDHISPASMKSDAGTFGPRNTAFTQLQLTTHPARMAFRMYDDDHTLYYEGFLVDPDEECDLFEPLYEFGEPNAGCTIIEYLNPDTGEYEEL